MHLLQAGILRDASAPCLCCSAPSGTCWCSGAPRDPRHDDGVFSGLILGPRGSLLA